MALHGVTIYGTDTYGYDIPPAYRVDPFVAAPINYSSIGLSWSTPAGNILAYRLIRNRWGYPVDQDDGEILIDSFAFPGNQFADTDVVPGTYHYYGFYILLNFLGNQWVRSGVTACLMPANYESGLELSNLIPNFYRIPGGIQSTAPVDNFPSTALDFFCEILGWGLDYLKTQYDTYLSVNDPWKIPLNDLLNLSEQLGININPDIHPYTLRKAVYFNATVNQQRGTATGINQELEILTGYSADLQISQNILLENDQSAFLDPQFPAWSANITYNIGEYVSFGNFWYQCLAGSNEGHQPTGSNTSNTWWSPVVNVDYTSFSSNSKTLYPNTWEILVPGNSNGAPASASLFLEAGIANPSNTSSFTYNGLAFYNNTGSTATIQGRSVSRASSDRQSNGPNFPPDKDQAVGDGIPVPFVSNALEWNSTTWNGNVRYGTNAIVTYDDVPFIALRASSNVVPPYSSRASVNNEWAPVSLEPRFRICISSYLQASSAGVTATPFVEWYDANGSFITRVTARNSSPGSVGAPSGLVYDSFTYPFGNILNSRHTDDGQIRWTQQKGTFQLSPFDGGCVYPQVASQRTYATIPSGVSNGTVGVTFVTNSASGVVQGLVLRWQDDSNYIRATMSEIDVRQAGTLSTLGVYSAPAQPGDRLTVQMNGSTLTAFINNVQVCQVTSSFNTSGTTHGIINEGSVVVANPGTQSNNTGSPI